MQVIRVASHQRANTPDLGNAAWAYVGYSVCLPSFQDKREEVKCFFDVGLLMFALLPPSQPLHRVLVQPSATNLHQPRDLWTRWFQTFKPSQVETH